jgi:hypothetical protein
MFTCGKEAYYPALTGHDPAEALPGAMHNLASVIV